MSQMNRRTTDFITNRKRVHRSDESYDSSSESNDQPKMSRKKEFRKGRKKIRTYESKGAASIVVAGKKSQLDRDFDDFLPKIRSTEKKSVNFHPSVEFEKREWEQKKHHPNSKRDDSSDDGREPEMIYFKSRKSVEVRTLDGHHRTIKVLAEDEHFWNNYICYAYERNGGLVVRFHKLQR